MHYIVNNRTLRSHSVDLHHIVFIDKLNWHGANLLIRSYKYMSSKLKSNGTGVHITHLTNDNITFLYRQQLNQDIVGVVKVCND